MVGAVWGESEMNRAGIGLHGPRSVHLALLAAGVALVVFAAAAATTAPLTEWFQTSAQGSPAGADQPKDAEESPAANTPNETSGKTRCKYCGIIESTRKVGSVHEITVRLADRSTHVFSDSNPANWRPGERIILIGGANSPRP
jgi:hypothetical protein